MSIRSLLTLCLLSLPSAAFAEQPRAEDEPSVQIEIRVVTVPAGVPLVNGPTREGEVAFLKDAQLKSLLDTMQGIRHANVMSAPKLTAFNNQAATMKCVENLMFVTTLEATAVNGENILVPKPSSVELGTTFDVRGRVSADKASVSLDVKYSEKRVERVDLVPVSMHVTPVFEGGSRGKPIPFTQFLQSPQLANLMVEKKDLRIPSGGHVVIGGPTFQGEVREMTRVPGLSELPYLGRLFTGTKPMKMRTVLIASTKVVEPTN